MPNYCLDTFIRLEVRSEVRQVSVCQVSYHDPLVSLAMVAKVGPGSRCPQRRLATRNWFDAPFGGQDIFRRYWDTRWMAVLTHLCFRVPPVQGYKPLHRLCRSLLELGNISLLKLAKIFAVGGGVLVFSCFLQGTTPSEELAVLLPPRATDDVSLLLSVR
jgi:hypothetical protein